MKIKTIQKFRTFARFKKIPVLKQCKQEKHVYKTSFLSDTHATDSICIGCIPKMSEVNAATKIFFLKFYK
jgi:hypothetical protein